MVCAARSLQVDRRHAWCGLTAVLVLVVAGACDSLPLLAPSESTIVLLASRSVLPLQETSTITAVITEPAGTPVANGTLVTFSTTLGTLDPPEARTTAGRATVTLRAGTTPGTATLSAFSGDATSNAISIEVVGP